MAETTTTTFMSLVLPVPGVRSGLNAASDNNTAFQALDSHDHSTGKGIKITPAGININADLSFGSFQVTSLKTSVFDSQAASLSSSFTNAVYVAGGDLYFNNSAGTAIQLTSAGTINVGSVQGISGLASPASAVYSAPTFTFKSASTTYAKVSHSELNLYEATAGITNAVTLKSPTSLAASYNVTFPAAAPGSTSYVSMDSSGSLSTASADTIAAAVTATGSNAISVARTRTTGTTVAAGGVAISASSGSATTTSGTYSDVTNLSVTITTSGRPVYLGLMSDGSGVEGYITVFATASTSEVSGNIRFVRGATNIAIDRLEITPDAAGTVTEIDVPASSFSRVDAVAAGTYTYKIQFKANLNSSMSFESVKFYAFEL